MKKFFFNSLIIAESIVVAASFTSCSKDNDGFLDEDGKEITGGDTYTGEYEWFDPCLQWGCTRDEVVAFMDYKGDWTLADETMGMMAYLKKSPMTNVTYMVTDRGLKNASVFYYTDKNPDALRKKVEDTYNCTLSLLEDSYGSAVLTYMAQNVSVNGKRCTVSFSVTKGMISVSINS